MTNQKILLTGGAGFIGFHLAKRLLEEGNNIVIIDNINDYYDVELKFARLKELGIEQGKIEYGKSLQSRTYPECHFIRLNLEDRAALEKLFVAEKLDVVCNLAAQAGVRYSIENPYAFINSNIVGFANILECCRHNHIKHLIYASSSSVYGNNNKVPFSEEDCVDYPVSMYAATKRTNELMAHTYSHLHQLPTTGLRFFTAYGPWGRPDMAPMLFAKAILNGETIKVFNHGDLTRDFTYIDDIIEGIVRIIDKIPVKEQEHPYYSIFNIGNSRPVLLMDFIRILEETIGKNADLEMCPMRPEEVKTTFADTTALENICGYSPQTPLKEGIVRFINWYKNDYFTVMYPKASMLLTNTLLTNMLLTYLLH